MIDRHVPPNALVHLAKWHDWRYMSVERRSCYVVFKLPWLAANVLRRLRREKTLYRKMLRRKKTSQCKRGQCRRTFNIPEGVAVCHRPLSSEEFDEAVAAWRDR